MEIFYANKKPVVLLTNNFDFTVEDIAEIYRLRWAIESLYKQLKQNFPLHFFYGDSVTAIQIQTWVVLIANLLITVLTRSIKRHCAFSQVVTMVRLMLIYYVDFIAFMENPEKTWNDFLAKEMQKAPPEQNISHKAHINIYSLTFHQTIKLKKSPQEFSRRDSLEKRRRPTLPLSQYHRRGWA